MAQSINGHGIQERTQAIDRRSVYLDCISYTYFFRSMVKYLTIFEKFKHLEEGMFDQMSGNTFKLHGPFCIGRQDTQNQMIKHLRY